MKTIWNNATIFITGVCGTVGKELLRQIIEKNPAKVIGIDNNESATYFLSQEYRNNNKVQLYVGDIRDKESMVRRTKGVDIILHVAALKHVYLCEESPLEAVRTNIMGTQSIIDAANYNNVKQVVYTSSDKAVNPTSVMGTAKLMAERLISAANMESGSNGTVFSTTRFGNILGSRGSVIPTFKKQIASGGPMTLTDQNMTRFIMSLEEAVELVIDSAELQQGGEVFVTKMPIIKITDLAEVMIRELASKYGHEPDDVKLDVVGARAGEKLYEELVNTEETRRTIELEKFYVILPALSLTSTHNPYSYTEPIGVKGAYSSEKGSFLTQEELREFLTTNELLQLDDSEV